jgi:predicted ATP-grasp superfamily ATP-dependent carboligase
MAGHIIDVCDPNPLCLGRFSRYTRRWYRCPVSAQDPWGYFDFILRLLRRNDYDVLFPAHEQAFLFSRRREQIPGHVGLAVADFHSFLQIQGKAAFVRTLSKLSIPQPGSRVVRTQEELEKQDHFPVYLKVDYGTASTGVWRIGSAAQLSVQGAELTSQGLFDGQREFVLQEVAQGVTERVQAVFDCGKRVAIHGYRQLAQSIGGGDIVKLSLVREVVQQHVDRLGEHLRWHGALSLDYIYQEENDLALFIDCNPRLVEPMNGVISGVNLADLLVRVSCGEPISACKRGRDGVRTHMLLMALLTAAGMKGSRLDVARELWRVICRRGRYASSCEELLPIQRDLWGLLPLAYVLTRLIVGADSAASLSAKTISSYSLGAQALQQIARSEP